MADIKEIEAEVEKDERVARGTIFKKDGTPYLAADGSEAGIEYVGSESKQYRTAKDAQQRKMLRSRSARLEPEDLRRARIELGFAGLKGWYGWESTGIAVPFGADVVKAWLKTEHILEQVETYINGHADFFTPSSTS